jgi:hypothetical protein
MRWLLFSYELNAIVKQCDDLLQAVGQAVLHSHHHGSTTLQEIKEQIAKHKPDRIIVVTNEVTFENDCPLFKTLNDHLMIPIYVSQATLNAYSSIRVLLLTFANANDTSESISSSDIIQNANNELISIYPHVIKYVESNFSEGKNDLLFSSARLFTPISDEDLNEKTLLKKFKSLWSNNPSESHCITILSDILPILLAFTHDDKATGQIDICNKGTISLNWFEQLISKQRKDSQINDIEDLTDQLGKWNKQFISPETRHLYQASFGIPNASKSLEQYLQQKSIHLNPNAPKILLVTGGCGFIGSTFINHWLETYPKDQIINIDRLDPVSNTKNIRNSSASNYSLIVADISNKDIVLHLMNQYNITHIVHFAGKNYFFLSLKFV